MKRELCFLSTLACILAPSLANAETISVQGALEKAEYQFHPDNYKPCKTEDYPLRNQFNKPSPSSEPFIGGCFGFNGDMKCDYTFHLGDKTSFEYYESNGTQCVKKTADQATPDFKKIFIYKFNIPTNLCENNACMSILSQQEGKLVGNGKLGDQAFMDVSYSKEVEQDVISPLNGFSQPSGTKISVQYNRPSSDATQEHKVTLVQSQSAPAPDTRDWGALKKLHDETFEKGEAMFYSEDAVHHLGLEVGCKGFDDALKSCNPFHCTDKVNLFGSTVYIDKMVFGFNSTNSCVMNSGASQYFIPKAELAKFSEIFLAPIIDSKASMHVDNGHTVTTNEVVQIFSGVECHVSIDKETSFDSNKVLVTDANENEVKGAMIMTGPDGKKYANKASVKKTYKISPPNSAACSQDKFEYIDSLIEKGLIVQMEPVMIGFEHPTSPSQR